MKTFRVTTKSQSVIINGISYYYNNIISVKGNDIDTLDYCEKLTKDGRLSVYGSVETKKIEKPKTNNKKSKQTKNNKSKDEDKNKNTKKEEK